MGEGAGTPTGRASEMPEQGRGPPRPHLRAPYVWNQLALEGVTGECKTPDSEGPCFHPWPLASAEAL